MNVVVVGGGIAGLSTAIGLARAGVPVTVLEQAARFDEVGAGLSLWPNAVRALDALGVGERVRRRSRESRRAVIRDPRGRVLSTVDVAAMARRFGPLLMIHRADLLDALVEGLPDSVAVQTGTTVQSVQPGGVVVHSAGTARADVVVGADGIDSVVRKSLWPKEFQPRYLGYTTYRMLTRPLDVLEDGEAWGRGLRFGWAPLPDGRVYCFAVVSAPEGQPAEGLSALTDRYHEWRAPVPDLLAATRPQAVLHHDLYELPALGSYVSGHVALVGDAAHAMAPNLGQGAGQGIEDAVTLAAQLATATSIPAALAAYDEQRRSRTQAIARRSRWLGRVAQWQAAPAVAVRDLVMRSAPRSAVLRAQEPVLSWRVPTDPAQADASPRIDDARGGRGGRGCADEVG